MFEETEFHPQPRKRIVSEDIRAAREAAALVRPINERLGDFQSDAVRLAARAERSRRSGGVDDALVKAAQALLDRVDAEVRLFEEEVERRGLRVTQHSRVADTRQALRLLADRLRLLS